MAEKKEVYATGGDGGFGVIAGIIVVLLIGVGLLFFAGVINPNERSIDVNVKLPKVESPAKTQ
ncbi:MAG: hypothetical protein H7X74_04125 [Methyloceanibacter sp.]|nr:hypothetical protein [Methyloceanibacter sp.]